MAWGCLVVSCGAPQADDDPVLKDRTSEQLMADPPEGWQLTYQLNNSTTRLSDYVPAGETDINWTAKISFESFSDIADADPIEMLLNEAEADRKRCSFVQHFNLYSGLENNYPTSVRLFMCGENTAVGRGEIKIIKAIQGQQYFYLVRILSRIEPFEVNAADFANDIIASWSSYLRTIKLCDSTDQRHPCGVTLSP